MLRLHRLGWSRWLPALVLAMATPSMAPPLSGQQPALDPEHAAKMVKGIALFKQHIKPILMQNCLRCHGGKAIESDLDLSARESLLKGGRHGPVVMPGKSGDSLLVKLISHQR